MTELDKGKPVSLEGPMVSTLAVTDALAKLLIEKGVITDAEVQTEAVGGACGLSAYSESYGTVNFSYRTADHLRDVYQLVKLSASGVQIS